MAWYSRRSMRSWRRSTARSAAMSSSSTLTGLMMKSYAPTLRLSMAVLTSPTPVSTITAASVSNSRIDFRNSSPSMIGIFTSVTVSGGRVARKTSSPSRPSLASSHL